MGINMQIFNEEAEVFLVLCLRSKHVELQLLALNSQVPLYVSMY